VAFLAPEEGEMPATGDADLAGPRAERALNALYALSPRVAAWFSGCLANCLSRLGRHEEGHVAIQRAVELARDTGARQLLGVIHMMQGAILTRVGRVDEAVAAWRAAVPHSEAAHDYDILAVSLGNLAAISVGRGDLVEAERRGLQSLEYANQLGDPHLIGICQTTLADVAFVRGNWRRARDALEGVKGAPDFVTRLVRAGLGRLDLAEGGTEQGIAALEAVAARSGAPQGVNVSIDAEVLARQTLAERALLAGRAADARAWLEACPEEEQVFNAGASIALAWALLELDEEERAERTLARVLAQAQGGGWRLLEVDALRVRALMEVRRGRGHEAVTALEEGVRLTRAIPYPYAEAKALYVYGLWHVSRGGCDEARAKFQEALDICDRLGERLYRARIAQALAALGT